MCVRRVTGRPAGMRTYAELPGLMTVMTGDEKHGPSATSTLDVLWVLYDQVLRVSPDRLDDPGRDRFLLSKGHGPAAYYAVLAAKEFIGESWLAGFGSAGSALGYHPDRNLVPGMEIASGSLGHGLPLGAGLAHGLLARGEELLGRWRRSRGITDSDGIVIATKVGARPVAPASSFDGVVMEGLSAKVLRESAARSIGRLGVSRLDLMYAHIEDPSVAVEETVGAFGELVASGEVGLLGVGNHWSWRVERARTRRC